MSVYRLNNHAIAYVALRRIPILDKRACQETGLWWQPSLRNESFLISSSNVRASYQDSSLQKQDRAVNITADSLTGQILVWFNLSFIRHVLCITRVNKYVSYLDAIIYGDWDTKWLFT